MSDELENSWMEVVKLRETSVRIAGIPVEIRTEHFPSASPVCSVVLTVFCLYRILLYYTDLRTLVGTNGSILACLLSQGKFS
jgi:hypothetical protein